MYEKQYSAQYSKFIKKKRYRKCSQGKVPYDIHNILKKKVLENIRKGELRMRSIVSEPIIYFF